MDVQETEFGNCTESKKRRILYFSSGETMEEEDSEEEQEDEEEEEEEEQLCAMHQVRKCPHVRGICVMCHSKYSHLSLF